MKVAVIIPTLKQDVLTIQSAPDDVDTYIVSEGTRSEARNEGARRAREDGADILVFCDDDIRFDENFLYQQIESLSEGELKGLKDFEFGLLLTRMMFIHTDDFVELGGFEETMNHMEDTEISLKALDNNMKITTIDRDRVEHQDHEKTINTRDRIKALGQLSVRHPSRMKDIIGDLI